MDDNKFQYFINLKNKKTNNNNNKPKKNYLPIFINDCINRYNIKKNIVNNKNSCLFCKTYIDDKFFTCFEYNCVFKFLKTLNIFFNIEINNHKLHNITTKKINKEDIIYYDLEVYLGYIKNIANKNKIQLYPDLNDNSFIRISKFLDKVILSYEKYKIKKEEVINNKNNIKNIVKEDDGFNEIWEILKISYDDFIYFEN